MVLIENIEFLGGFNLTITARVMRRINFRLYNFKLKRPTVYRNRWSNIIRNKSISQMNFSVGCTSAVNEFSQTEESQSRRAPCESTVVTENGGFKRITKGKVGLPDPLFCWPILVDCKRLSSTGFSTKCHFIIPGKRAQDPRRAGKTLSQRAGCVSWWIFKVGCCKQPDANISNIIL